MSKSVIVFTFCADYLSKSKRMVLTAIYSAATNSNLNIVVNTNSSDEDLIRLTHKLRITTINRIGPFKSYILAFFEAPIIAKDLGYDQCLFLDADTITFSKLHVEPTATLSGCSEMVINSKLLNTGVVVFNTKWYHSIYDELVDFIFKFIEANHKNRIEDQVVINNFINGNQFARSYPKHVRLINNDIKWTKLHHHWNYKAYWDNSITPLILHFQCFKPSQIRKKMDGKDILNPKINDRYNKLSMKEKQHLEAWTLRFEEYSKVLLDSIV